MGQPLADCDFNLAALHPAYPIKRRTSAERTQASPVRRHPEESPALDPLENSIRRLRSSAARGPIGSHPKGGNFLKNLREIRTWSDAHGSAAIRSRSQN